MAQDPVRTEIQRWSQLGGLSVYQMTCETCGRIGPERSSRRAAETDEVDHIRQAHPIDDRKDD